ncbi:MAG: hypothetical protein ABSB73_13860 [Solirubrobacteraceae bacterium]|jgi:hypothetical protein
MKSRLSKKLVIAATAAVLLGGAAVAVAATQSSSGSGEQAYINDIAGRLQVSPSALTAAIKAADNDQITAAVAAKRLTPAEATSLEQRIAQSTSAPLLGGRFGRGFGHAGSRGGLRDITSAAAQYLGISESTLRSDLAGGKSLDAIANSTPDKSASDLQSAVLASLTTQLNAAANAGTITSAQKNRRLTNLSSRIDAVLADSWSGHAGSGTRGRGGPWGGRGATGASGEPWGSRGATGATGAPWGGRGRPGASGVDGSSLFGSSAS